MPRRPLHILSLLSAVICAASLLLVVRSFVRADAVSIPIGQNNSGLGATIDGSLVLMHLHDSMAFEYASVGMAQGRSDLDGLWSSMTGIRWLAIGWGTYLGIFKVLILPLWLVPILTAILPVRWWLIHRRRRRDAARGFPVVPSSPAAAGAGAAESSTNANEHQWTGG